MPIPSSGPFSMRDIFVERFGSAPTNAFTMTYLVGWTPSVNQVAPHSMSEFRGYSNVTKPAVSVEVWEMEEGPSDIYTTYRFYIPAALSSNLVIHFIEHYNSGGSIWAGTATITAGQKETYFSSQYYKSGSPWEASVEISANSNYTISGGYASVYVNPADSSSSVI